MRTGGFFPIRPYVHTNTFNVHTQLISFVMQITTGRTHRYYTVDSTVALALEASKLPRYDSAIVYIVLALSYRTIKLNINIRYPGTR